MSIITGVTVDFATSPRIITIPIPITLVTLQDLHDTLRDIEDEPNVIQYLHLIDSAGKENLGGGLAVGITSTLQNAKVAFAARPGPTTIQCILRGGNLVAVDSVGADLDPVEPTAFTQVVRELSSSGVSLDIGALTLAQFVALSE